MGKEIIIVKDLFEPERRAEYVGKFVRDMSQ